MIKIHILSFATALLISINCPGYSDAPQTRQRSTARQRPISGRVEVQRTIIVNKADNLLKLFITGQPYRYWRVATGKYHCTPEGTFRIIEKSYISRSGDTPLGTRWLGLNTLGRRHLLRVGIHGTNDPQSIGHWASLACIRMHNSDVNYLYELVPIGTTVKVVNISSDKPAKSAIQHKQIKTRTPMKMASFRH